MTYANTRPQLPLLFISSFYSFNSFCIILSPLSLILNCAISGPTEKRQDVTLPARFHVLVLWTPTRFIYKSTP